MAKTKEAKRPSNNRASEYERNAMAALKHVLLCTGFGILEGTHVQGFLVYIDKGHLGTFVNARREEADRTISAVGKLCSMTFHVTPDVYLPGQNDKRLLLNVLSAL